MSEIAYTDWPAVEEGWRYVDVATIDPRVSYVPKGHRGALFLTLSDGQKIVVLLPLDELNAAVAQINADPSSKLRVIEGGKVS